jgi:hypothetical protein
MHRCFERDAALGGGGVVGTCCFGVTRRRIFDPHHLSPHNKPAAAAPSHYKCAFELDVAPTEADVGARLCERVAAAARASIAKKGSFLIAVPGGSVLKMLGGLKEAQGVDWGKGARARSRRRRRFSLCGARALQTTLRRKDHQK